MEESSKLTPKLKWKQQAKRFKSEVFALYFAARDSRVPWYTKLFIVLVVGYALSPIDLIPDFVPILGYLDDLVLIPLGVTLAIKMIPPNVMDEARLKAHELKTKPKNWAAAAVIIALWVLVLVLVVLFILKKLKS